MVFHPMAGLAGRPGQPARPGRPGPASPAGRAGHVLLVSFQFNCPSNIWGQFCQCHLGSIMTESFGSIVIVSFGFNCARIIWVQLCSYHLSSVIHYMKSNLYDSSARAQQEKKENMEATFACETFANVSIAT